MKAKIVTVNGIVVQSDLNGMVAFDAVIKAATLNRIHSFDVEVDGELVDETEIREIGADWSSIEIKTSEKPA